MFRNDPKTFDKLCEIVAHYASVYEGDKKMVDPESKKPFGFNPFFLYQAEFGEVRKYSKHDDGPVIKTVKYLDGKLGSALDISSHYNAHDKKVVLLQLTKFRTDFYFSKGMWKFVTIPTYAVKLDHENGNYYIDKDWYSQMVKAKGIESIDDFRFSMSRNDYIGIEFVAPKSVENGVYRFIATNNDTKNVVEINRIDRRAGKQLTITIGKPIKQLKKYQHDLLGNRKEIKKEELVFEF